MRWTYSCPHCKAMLNPDETVILVGVHQSERVLVGFHPKPGNYRAYFPPGITPEKGDEWHFLCPVCDKTLETGVAPKLCALDMVAGDVRHRVYFSRTAGDKSTFLISAEGVEHHGPHAERHSLEMLEMI